MPEQMKAWTVQDKNGDGYAYTIYAETRGKAIQNAMHHTDGAFDWYEFTEIRAIREPKLDKYFKGKAVLEWYNMEDRTLMVREVGFYCGYEMDVTMDECEQCPAHEWCRRYERMVDNA